MVKSSVLEQTQGLHLQVKFHLNVFIVSASGDQKPHFSANFDIFWLLYRPPFIDGGQIWYAIADTQYTFTCELSSRSVYSVVLWRRKKTISANFCCFFWISAFSDVASWHQSQKVEHGCTATNLPLSNGIKIVSVLQRLHGDIGRTNSDVQKRDGQTDKQTDKHTKTSTFLATKAAGEIRAPPNLAW